MPPPLLIVFIAAGYLAIATIIGYRVHTSRSNETIVIPTKVFSSTALLWALHCFVVIQRSVVDGGINLSIENVAALVAALVIFFYLASSLTQPVRTLGLVLLPAAALSVLALLTAPTEQIVAFGDAGGVGMHVLLSLIAYSLLAIAAVQALALAYQESQLERKRNSLLFRALPPLQTMEKLLFRMISVGFGLLSLALLTALPLIDSIIEQHLIHKTILSVVAWIVFAILLAGHYIAGWRGRTAVQWTLSGFAVLILAYFGSKFVLEILIGESWS